MTIATQGCFQSRSMPLGLVAARSQRESSGVNQHVGRSQSGISIVPTVGFPNLMVCPNGHTLAIWHLHSGTSPISLSNDLQITVVITSNCLPGEYGDLPLNHLLAKNGRDGPTAPYGQSWTINIRYRCFLLPLIMSQPITTGFSQPQQERVCFSSARLDPSHIPVFLTTWWNTGYVLLLS